MSTQYKADLVKAVEKLDDLLAKREGLETEIARQKRRVAALHELAMPEEEATPITGLVDGLTDACRVIFRSFDRSLLPLEIRDRVQSLGLPPQANLLASIHTTIRRLREAGEIIEDAAQPGAYKWAGETAPARVRRRIAEKRAEGE